MSVLSSSGVLVRLDLTFSIKLAPMARKENVIEYRPKDHQEQVDLLNLAQMLGSVSQACKMMDYSRDSFFRLRRCTAKAVS